MGDLRIMDEGNGGNLGRLIAAPEDSEAADGGGILDAAVDLVP